MDILENDNALLDRAQGHRMGFQKMTFDEARLIAIKSKKIADEYNQFINREPSKDFDELTGEEQARVVQGISTVVQAMQLLGYQVEKKK